MTISLEVVRLHGFHGVFEQENVVGADFELSLDLHIPTPKGAYTDDLDDTISYADVYEIVRERFDRPAKLLEYLARDIAVLLCKRWPQIFSVNVKIKKLAPPIPTFQGIAAVTCNYTPDYES